MEHMIIYRASFQNGKSYIGQTILSLTNRKRVHKHTSKNMSRKSAFYSAVRKYGFESIQWEVLKECKSFNQMQKEEYKYIFKFNTKYPNGYNINDGGKQYVMSQETKDKIRNSHLGKKRGPMSEEHKQKIGNSVKVSWEKPGQREYFSKIRKGVKKINKPSGWKLSEKTKKRMSESAKKSGTGKWMKEVWRQRKLLVNKK